MHAYLKLLINFLAFNLIMFTYFWYVFELFSGDCSVMQECLTTMAYSLLIRKNPSAYKGTMVKFSWNSPTQEDLKIHTGEIRSS